MRECKCSPPPLHVNGCPACSRRACKRSTHLDRLDTSRVFVVVRGDLDELWKVPAIPLLDAHGERVDVLIESVEQRNGLNDHVVLSVDIEFYL